MRYGSRLNYISLLLVPLLLSACAVDLSISDIASRVNSSEKSFSMVTAGGIVATKNATLNVVISSSDSPTEIAFFDGASCVGPEIWEPYVATKALSLLAPDGVKSFSARVKFDDSISDCESVNVLFDQTAPQSTSLSRSGGAGPLNNPLVMLTPVATDISLPIEVFISDEATCSVGTWSSASITAAHTLSAPTANFDGTKSVFFKFSDALGNETSCAQYDLFLDTIAPVLTINSNISVVTATSGSIVNLSGTCTEDGTSNVNLTATSSGGGTFTPATTDCAAGIWSQSIDLANLQDGTVRIFAAQTDVAGNTGSEDLDVVMDRLAPILTFTSPAALTYIGPSSKSAFNITGTCSENGSGNISISSSSLGGGSYGGSTTSCASSLFNVSLDLNGLNDGVITVTLSLSDAVGNTIQVSRDFNLDTQAPVLSAVTLAGGATYATAVTVGMSLTTTGSPTEYYATETASCASGGSWLSISSPSFTLSSAQGGKTVYAKVRDAAGNESACLSDAITYDSVAPLGTVAINSGDSETVLGDVAVSLTASADTAEMYVFEGSCPAASPVYSVYLAETNVTLASFVNTDATSEVRYVSAMLKDSAGNVACVTDADGILLWNSRNSISFRGSGFRVLDSAGSVSVPVYLRDYTGTLPRTYQAPIQVEYSLSDGTSISKGSVTLASGSSEQNISIPIPDVATEQSLRLSLHFTDKKNVPLHSLTEMSISVVDAAAVNTPIGLISSLGDHTCVLKGANALSLSGSYGKLFCWGEGEYRQIDGTKTTRLSPTAVDAANDYVDVAAGSSHTCGILNSTGVLKCWGANESGQLGKGGSVDATPPAGFFSVTHPGALSWIGVSAGYSHSCAIDSAGKLYCWGDDSYGQLGNGATTGVQTSPVEVDSASVTNSWSQVSTGYYHTCAVHSTKYVYCWGANGSGQANPSSVGVNAESPARITLPGNVPATNPDLKVAIVNRLWDRERRVGAGGNHSCAVTSHLGADNTDTNDRARLYCWGKNESLQAGDVETNLIVTVPKRVAATAFYSVTLGDDNSCAITYSATLTARTLRCFGNSDFGKLGYGGSTYGNIFVVDRDAKDTATTLVNYNSVGLGGDHSCAVAVQTRRDSDDASPLAQYSVRCAGNSRSGQLGQGEFSSKLSPTIVDGFSVGTGGPRAFSMVSAGNRNVCGLDSGGELYCWGPASYKLIGEGVSSSSGNAYGYQRSGPVKIEHGTVFSRIAVGLQQACAITSLGRLKCWGENSDGHLGVGNSDLGSPVSINPSQAYQEVSSGDGHVCAITTTGILHCFGLNGSGQLGEGTTSVRKTPQVIDSGVSYLKVSAGKSHTCAITSTEKLKCWGLNLNGQLGLGDTASRLSPAAVDAASDYLDVAVGGDHTCALKKVTASTGQVLCWGKNEHGQLGNNASGVDVLTPEPLKDSGGAALADLFTKLAAGESNTCAIRDDDKVLCWGYNSSGQVGDNTKISRINPTLTSIDAALAIGVTGDSACAVEQAGGVLKCWGYDEFGNLGLRKKNMFFQFVPEI